MERKKLNTEKKKKESGQKKKKVRSDFFFQTGRRRFNIFITLKDYCGGYPRVRGA